MEQATPSRSMIPMVIITLALFTGLIYWGIQLKEEHDLNLNLSQEKQEVKPVQGDLGLSMMIVAGIFMAVLVIIYSFVDTMKRQQNR